jgi:hypothetical protein
MDVAWAAQICRKNRIDYWRLFLNNIFLELWFNSRYLYTMPRIFAFTVAFISISSPLLAASKEVSLSTAGAPYAPLDVTKHGHGDPYVPLSKSQRNELLGEFKGMVHMGLRPVSYEKWEGREMADCDKPQSTKDRWTYRCEIITGEGNGYYYFYPTESRQSATLQELDIRVNGADETLLEDIRAPVQALFGRASLVTSTTVHAKPTGPIRHWNTGSDVAELFIDHSVRPEGSVRFVWLRSPLVGGANARLLHTVHNSETDN